MRSGISGPRHRGTLLLVVLSCLSDTARAMSQENVETVRRTYTAFNDGDLGTVLEIFDPNIEWNASDVFFDQPRTYRGRRTWQEEFLRDLMQLFEDYRGEPEEIRDGATGWLPLSR